MGFENWLLLLGAGASRPDPCGLPPFGPLSGAILNSIGWKEHTDEPPGPVLGPSRTDSAVVRWRFTKKPFYPDIARLDTAAEVLFGTLSSFGVEFTQEVCTALSTATPNAVHEVAAHVLRDGGCVWTPNIDDGVEHACANLGLSPPRAGRTLDGHETSLSPLVTATTGTYVKFHGTVEAPSTLAFTDRQLIAPLSDTDVDHLAALAKGRLVVIYGYAGADADLSDLLDRVLADAEEVWWFEPKMAVQELIAQAFPLALDQMHFVPDLVVRDVPDLAERTDGQGALHKVGASFLELATAAGYVPDPELARLLIEGRGPLRKLKHRPERAKRGYPGPSGREVRRECFGRRPGCVGEGIALRPVSFSSRVLSSSPSAQD